MSERIFFEYPEAWLAPDLAIRADKARLEACEELGLLQPYPRIRWYSRHGDPVAWPFGMVFRSEKALAGKFHGAVDKHAVWLCVEYEASYILQTIRHEFAAPARLPPVRVGPATGSRRPGTPSGRIRGPP
ncbi:MAG TPA: hypothetical protein VGQ85_02865 [Candidatus Limnocylindrales bacterium]|nr:hypothetical protein [Candidatus Limnocylindrales bacterium]